MAAPVSPAHAGVEAILLAATFARYGQPRACGGRGDVAEKVQRNGVSAPRMRG